MKRTSTIIAFILFFGLQAVNAQQSDYQIKTEFENRYAKLADSIRMATSVAETDSLAEIVDEFEQDFLEYEALLNKALYPDNFPEKIEQLEKIASSAEQRLLVIESQNEKLNTLTADISTYESEINNLNSKVESLRQSITSSENSEKQLSGLVRQYRTSLEERDEFILAVIDSMLITYEGLSPEAVSELSEGAESGEVDNDENPLQIFNSIITDNLQALKASGESLDTEDYLRMYVVQHRFEKVWNQIGGELVTIYGGSDKDKWKSTIEDKLNDWQASASKNMWDSLDTYLEEKKLDLNAFDNNQSFFAALDSYVKNATDDSRNKMLTSDNYENFQNFYEFWNGKIKNDWNNFVREGEVLTFEQISTIDSEIVNWRDEAKPRSFLIPILLAISLLIIVGLVIVIARK